MQALILAGGEGSRLRPLTINTPKPIVPIGNQPFLLRQIQLLKNAGVIDVILSLGYQPTAIQRALGDGSDYGVKLRYLIEPAPMGTAGAYKFAEQFLETTTVVLNGDILTDIDLQTVARQHENRAATATIVLTEVENPSVYGLVEIDAGGKVLKFLEKPKSHEINEININTINAGIYILEPQVLDFIPAGESYSFEYQVFPNLLQSRENFRAFVASDNYWLDIGTPERYLRAHHDLLAGKIKNFQVNRSSNFKMSAGADVDDASCVGSDCEIKNGAKIINSVLAANVVVGENTIVQDSVVWAGTRIDSDASILNAVIGSDCQIGKNVSVGKDSVLGDKTILADSARY